MFYNTPECTYKFIVPLIFESHQLVKEVLNFIQTKPSPSPNSKTEEGIGGDGGYFPPNYKKSQLANS